MKIYFATPIFVINTLLLSVAVCLVLVASGTHSSEEKEAGHNKAHYGPGDNKQAMIQSITKPMHLICRIEKVILRI